MMLSRYARARQIMEDRVAKLEAFGSADQLRDFFVAQEIVGDQGLRTSCPVANYLRQEIETEIGPGYDAGAVSVGGDGIWLRGTDPDPLSCPPVILHFIVAFDSARYPELVMDEVFA